MSIELVSYSYVTANGNPPTAEFRDISAEIAEYLEHHREKLLHRAKLDSVAEGHFDDPDASQRFEDLCNGSDQEFLAASQDLASRLHVRMDNRSKPGFFVAIRFSNDDERSAAILKLDVHEEPLAAVGGTATEPALEEVQNLLDIPGELQKGAVYPDPRAESDVCVGDKQSETSQYFLNSIEVTQHERAGRAIGPFLSVVRDVAPDSTDAVVGALTSSSGRTDVTGLLDTLEEPLSDDERNEIVQRLATRRRPIQTVNSDDHQLRGLVEAAPFTVQGPATSIRDDVTWEPDPDNDGYVVHLRVKHEPTKKYK